jgi:diacylglycerol kinase (ATP)
MKTLVLINKNANNSTGWNKWLTVRDEVKNLIPGQKFEVVAFTPPFDIYDLIVKMLDLNEKNTIISVGGDGTHNFILNSIMRLPLETRGNITLGAIGLGSSNDFTKPALNKIKNIPFRLNFKHVIKHDIGKLVFNDPENKEVYKYFMINASVGILSEANYLFNKGDWFINKFKDKHVNLTIQYTALKTLFNYKPQQIKLVTQGKTRDLHLNNLSVLKNPHISGSFKYNQEIFPDDGKLGLNYCHGMNKMEVLTVMRDLEKGAFQKNKFNSKRISEFVYNTQIYSKNNLAIETDGEVYLGNNIEFKLSKFKLSVLGLGF